MIDLYKSLTIGQFIAALETLNQSIERCDHETWIADHIDLSVSQVVFRVPSVSVRGTSGGIS